MKVVRSNNSANSHVHCRNMAVNEKTGCCPPQMAYTVHLLERQDNKRGGQNQNWTTNRGQHSERKTTWLAWTCDVNGSPAHATASVVLRGTRIQERTRSTTNELEEHSQQQPMGSAGRKQRWQLLTDTNGVGVWSNVSTWMRDESRSMLTFRQFWPKTESRATFTFVSVSVLHV